MSEKETGEFLRASAGSPNVMEIHCSTMPFGNQSIMTVTIPGHVPYRELYRTHPDNTLITALTLLRRVANDYAALLVKCSTTLEPAEQGIDTAQSWAGYWRDRSEVEWPKSADATQGDDRDRSLNSQVAFESALTEESEARELHRDELLRAALRVVLDLV